jgi:hypothetical protein
MVKKWIDGVSRIHISVNLHFSSSCCWNPDIVDICARKENYSLYPFVPNGLTRGQETIIPSVYDELFEGRIVPTFLLEHI